MGYPNLEFWAALDNGRSVQVDDESNYLLSTIDCGVLSLLSGQLVACDPFAGLEKNNNKFLQIPSGQYKVVVTLADVSDEKDGSHMREAYATLLLDADSSEVKRKIITPTREKIDVPPEMDAGGQFYGFPVDAGTACFTDNTSIEKLMPDGDWHDEIFDDGTSDSWFDRMDDPKHIRDGLANIILPNATNGENIILIHSGWGDGFYPVIGGYNAKDELIRVHIDFMVVFDERIS